MSSAKTMDRKKKVVQAVKIAQVVRSRGTATNGHVVKNGRSAASHPAKNDDPLVGQIYRPSDSEPFMNERQREYFRRKLLDWKEEILKEAKETLTHLQTESENHPDLADRASSETDRAIELRARDRQRKLIAKIEAALDYLEADASALTRDRFNIGHLAIGCALGYLDFRYADDDWRSGHSKLAEWHKEFAERASVKLTAHANVY